MLFEGQHVIESGTAHAPPGRRVLAWSIDAAVTALFTAALMRGYLALTSKQSFIHLWEANPWWVVLAAPLAWFLYRAFGEFGGQSLGKWICGIGVVAPEGRPGLVRAVARAASAPFDAVLGHLERDGPFERRLQLRVVEIGRERWHGAAVWALVVVLAAAWLSFTRTSTLVHELALLETQEKCGVVPRAVLHATDRKTDDAVRRCENVMTQLTERAVSGDAQAIQATASLPFAKDWK